MIDLLNSASAPGSILTTKECAVIIGCSVATVVRACDESEIKHFRTPGGHRRIHLSDLRDYMNARTEDPHDHFA